MSTYFTRALAVQASKSNAGRYARSSMSLISACPFSTRFPSPLSLALQWYPYIPRSGQPPLVRLLEVLCPSFLLLEHTLLTWMIYLSVPFYSIGKNHLGWYTLKEVPTYLLFILVSAVCLPPIDTHFSLSLSLSLSLALFPLLPAGPEALHDKRLAVLGSAHLALPLALLSRGLEI